MSRMDLVVPNLKKAFKLQLLIGKCIPSVKQDASKIRIKRLELDQNLLKYFNKFENVFISDPEKVCKYGDIVLIRKMQSNLTKIITHELVKVVYPFGDVTDPITGKKVAWLTYRDDLEKEMDVSGRLPSTFDYNSAPPRGWTEGTKSFAEKPTYTKYHIFEDEDPYSIG